MILIDTCIWSEALRKNKASNQVVIEKLKLIIENGDAALIGPIRQELLNGLRGQQQFERLNKYMLAFDDIEIKTEDYVLAARNFNKCREQGIQGSNTDFLLTAVSYRTNYPLFTLDQDFLHFSKILTFNLFNFLK